MLLLWLFCKISAYLHEKFGCLLRERGEKKFAERFELCFCLFEREGANVSESFFVFFEVFNENFEISIGDSFML